MSQAKKIGTFSRIQRASLREAKDYASRLGVIESFIEEFELSEINRRLSDIESRLGAASSDIKNISLLPNILAALGIVIAIFLGIYAIIFPMSYSKETIDEKFKATQERFLAIEKNKDEPLPRSNINQKPAQPLNKGTKERQNGQ